MKKEITMHTIICDGCGKNVNEYSDFVAWCDVQGAIEEADIKDWIKLQEKDYCTNCWEWDEKEEEQILKSKKDEIIQEFLMKDNEGIFYELKESNMDIREKYWAKAKEFANAYGVEASQHIIEVMASAMMTRDNVMQGGSFVQAVVKNDLAQAISCADASCLANIKIIVSAFRFARIGFDSDGFPEPEVTEEEHLNIVKEAFNI